MSDTPTYDQLSALCAQLAAALETVKQQDVYGKLSFRVHVALEKALTAYRTLSPDPVYAEAKNLLDALQNMLGIYDTPLSRRRFPPNDFMNEAINTARETANRARGEG